MHKRTPSPEELSDLDREFLMGEYDSMYIVSDRLYERTVGEIIAGNEFGTMSLGRFWAEIEEARRDMQTEIINRRSGVEVPQRPPLLER